MIDTVEQLENTLSEPTPDTIKLMAELEGDLMILGVGGKMGPTMAKLARRSADATGRKIRIVGPSIFPDDGTREDLEKSGIETISCDMLNRDALAGLPDIPNIIYMAGRKFGSTGAECETWAMNSYLPGLVADRFRKSRIVAFSTGNVYPLSRVLHGGTDEKSDVAPIGEYAQSCLGRERIFEHFSMKYNIPVLLFRLSYAIDLRYGVILDIAQKVAAKQPVDVTMGHAAVIWQLDANSAALRCLPHCGVPPTVLNVTGPETISLRWLAKRLGELLDTEPIIVGQEAETALLVNAARACALLGYPSVSLDQMVQWIAHWVKIGGPTLNKPTHFETRDGKF